MERIDSVESSFWEFKGQGAAMERIDSVESSFWEFKGQGEYTDRKLLMATPFPVAFTLVIYLWFVLKFGPEFMKSRKPFQLRNIIVAYNFSQVLISIYIVKLGIEAVHQLGMWNSTCFSEEPELGLQLLDGSHYYFLAKVVELLDTVFFVLRKNQRQVSFLHVYHHTLMVIATWSIVKYNKIDSIVFLGSINSLVHIVMYAYYGLSVFPALKKYLWWKKYITIMQLVQFCMMFVHIVVSHITSDCKPAYVLLFAVCSNTVLFLYLFGDFYIKSYTKKATNTYNINDVPCISEDLSKPSSVNPNGDAKNSLNDFMNRHKLAAKIN